MTSGHPADIVSGAADTTEAFQPLTATEAARVLGLSERTVRRAIGRGHLAADKRRGVFVITPRALDDFRTRRARANAAVAPPRHTARLVRLPLRDPLAPPSLPPATTQFVGRERLITAIADQVRRDNVRQLTLTGPGGVGKTRLALEVARGVTGEFPDGVWFVDLAPIAEPNLVATEIAQALGIRLSRQGDTVAQLTAALRNRRALLVLDNFEQVIAAAPTVAAVLSACPAVTVLVTSRVRLNLSAEHERVVPPLAVGVDKESIEGEEREIGSEAARLFVQRVRARMPGFMPTDDEAEAIAAICRRLDGLPLAIELAAARAPLLPPRAMLARLERRLPLLTGGARDSPERQQTMRATIAWGYDLLDPGQQRLFRHLAVFTGGFTLDAATAVAGEAGVDDLLDRVGELADNHLLYRSRSEAPDHDPRFAMLETVREFGLERLDAEAESTVARQRHAAYFLAVAENRAPELPIPGDHRWLGRVAPELDNVRQALTWLAECNETDALLRLAAALYELWLVRGLYGEGRRWLDQALAASALEPSPPVIRALAAAGVLAAFQRDYATAARRYDQEVERARVLGDPYRLAEALIDLGHLAYLQGDYGRAEILTSEATELLRGLEATVPAAAAMAALTMANLGDVALARGDTQTAGMRYETAIVSHRAARYRWGLFEALCGLGMVRLRQGRVTDAAALLDEGLALAWSLQEPMQVADALLGLATVAGTGARAEDGALLLGAADDLFDAIGGTVSPRSRGCAECALRLCVAALGSDAVARAHAAGRDMAASAAMALAREVAREAIENGAGQVGAVYGLTAREGDVLRLLVSGKTDREIADALFISRRTVTTHTSSIFTKLGVSSRTEAATLAVREGLV